jgi:hypothetical protein
LNLRLGICKLGNNYKILKMKKVLFTFALVAAFGFISCKKCQTCTTSTSQTVSGLPEVATSTSQEYCGDEYDNAPAQGSVSQSLPGIEQTVAISCVDD